MSTPTDGGPAFPVPPGSINFTGDSRDGVGYEESQPGMTLRDYFAAKALQGLCACPDTLGSYSDFALTSYEYADAMLAERRKKTT